MGAWEVGRGDGGGDAQKMCDREKEVIGASGSHAVSAVHATSYELAIEWFLTANLPAVPRCLLHLTHHWCCCRGASLIAQCVTVGLSCGLLGVTRLGVRIAIVVDSLRVC